MLICSLYNFLNLRRTKSIQHIGLKFLGTVNCAVPALSLFLTNVFVAPSETVLYLYANEADIINKYSPVKQGYKKLQVCVVKGMRTTKNQK